MNRIYLESNTAQVSYNPQEGFFRLTIKKFIKDEDFKEVLQRVMKWFSEHESTKILNDFRNFKGVSPALQEWVTKTYYPNMVKGGLKQAALVLNNDVFAKVSGKKVKSEVDMMFLYKAFPSIEEAEGWLAQTSKY
ncbi:MAG TPA: hypothetical protein DCS93_33390 [Microscillaceae bacterium]|nr:hypothetical protein [Microscillaceae bacterium]